MKSLRKFILPIIILLLAIGGYAGWKMYNQQLPDLAKSPAAHQVDAATFYAEFVQDEPAANEKYLNQVIAVTGAVDEVQALENGGAVVVVAVPDEMFGITCSMAQDQAEAAQALTPGSMVTLKGECTGYLMDVNLVRCVIM